MFVDGAVPPPADACPNVTLLTPFDVSNLVGTSHTVKARLVSPEGNPLPGRVVTFTVIAGPNEEQTGVGVTDADGEATFSYVGSGGAGVDRIEATFEDPPGVSQATNAVEAERLEQQAAKQCVFDVNGDGRPELSLVDADGDGFCEFPENKTHLRGGPLTFTEETPVEFTGTTLLEADRIVIEEGAQLTGRVPQLRSLTMVAMETDFDSRGSLDFDADDDRPYGPSREASTSPGSRRSRLPIICSSKDVWGP
jgi:hypothetical protein